jgi:hypothetical protein
MEFRLLVARFGIEVGSFLEGAFVEKWVWLCVLGAWDGRGCPYLAPGAVVEGVFSGFFLGKMGRDAAFVYFAPAVLAR